MRLTIASAALIMSLPERTDVDKYRWSYRAVTFQREIAEMDRTEAVLPFPLGSYPNGPSMRSSFWATDSSTDSGFVKGHSIGDYDEIDGLEVAAHNISVAMGADPVEKRQRT